MVSTNIPVQLTSFVGREREIAEVSRLLDSSRLVTLTGAGGSGKTRLAIQIANALSETFSAGVWLVDLSSLREPALVLQYVVEALGLRPVADQPLLETLLLFLHSKQLLLILDNCEHLSDPCAQLAQGLLAHLPLLRILATSRAELAVAGETLYPVSGLDWPAPGDETLRDGQNRLDLQKLMEYAAVRLFVERARAISPNFSLTSENARAAVEICRRLDGLPLAIELASARVNVLTVQEIAVRLNDRFTLLISVQRGGLEPRHHTLRAAINWSYALLTGEERILLRRLAVFDAGFSLDAVDAICTGEGDTPRRSLDLISSLVSKSLVVAETIDRAQARYSLLETVREYALEKLNESGETERLRDRHLELFLARAEEAAPKLGEAYQQLWLNWLEGEHDNLRAALSWSMQSGLPGSGLGSSRIETGLRIACALVRFWEIRGHVQEGLAWFERLLAQVDSGVSPGVHVNGLVYASFLTMFLGDAPATLAYARKAVDIAEGVSDVSGSILSFALAGLASGARAVGDYQTAFDIEERAIQLLRGSPETSFYLGMALLAQGDVAIQMGLYAAARERLEESLALARQDGDSFRAAHALNSLGDLERCELNYSAAQSDYESSAALLRELGAQHDLASIVCNLGHTWLHLGEVERAKRLFNESLAIHQAQQNNPGMRESLVGFAAAALASGLPGAGARLLAAAAPASAKPAAIVWMASRQEFDRCLDLAQASLSAAEFQAEQAAGRAMSLEQTVEYARDLLTRPAAIPGTSERPGGLTEREYEVAVLVAQGKSNAEIAQALVLSKRTVETHVSNILSKLALPNRAQIMHWAIRQSQTPPSL